MQGQRNPIVEYQLRRVALSGGCYRVGVELRQLLCGRSYESRVRVSDVRDIVDAVEVAAAGDVDEIAAGSG